MKQSIYKQGILGCLLSLATCGFTACNDQLADELFVKNSYIINNGWKDYHLSVNKDNTALLPIYFGVNGTSTNDKDIVLTMDIDPDTLAGYNWEKYKNQKDLYYKILPQETYTFDQTSWTIPQGALKATAMITIDLNQIARHGSLYDDYVLPLQITSSSGEPMGERKYTKALAHIAFKNDYSGIYSGKGIITQKGTSYTTEISSLQLNAINNDKCYFFAGDKNRSNTADYLNYVIESHRNALGDISLVSTHPDLQLEPYEARISRKYTYNYTDQRYYTEVTTIQLAYEYVDNSLAEPTTMVFDGTFSMSRDVLRHEYPDVEVEE